MLKEFLVGIGIVHYKNVSPNNRLVSAHFLNEEDLDRVRAGIAQRRMELDRKTGADKIEKQNV